MPDEAVRDVVNALARAANWVNANPEEARKLETGGKPIAVVSQTTLSLDDVAATVDALADEFGTLTRPHADDICYATQNRQDAVKILAPKAEVVIVRYASHPIAANAGNDPITLPAYMAIGNALMQP